VKEVVSAGIILSLIISLSFFTNAYTDRNTAILMSFAEECESAVLSDDWETALESIKKARESFVKTSHALESYLLHEDIERLSDILTNIEISVEQNDKRAAIANVKIFTRRLHELSESDKLTLNNIL